ncbi:MAG TPA: response regulator [Puia sp.]|jgi:DNA-binding NtrC family response regulator
MPVNTVFIIDDDDDDIRLMKDAITGIDPLIHIQPFRDGATALLFLEHCAENELPNVLIVDYQMPLMTGPQLLEQLNKVRYLSIPKFILSTSSTIQHKISCTQAGAWRYFTKPSTFAELNEIVRQILDECHNFK